MDKSLYRKKPPVHTISIQAVFLWILGEFLQLPRRNTLFLTPIASGRNGV